MDSFLNIKVMYQPFLVKLLILKHAKNLSFEVLISENRNYPGPVISRQIKTQRARISENVGKL